MTPKQDLLSWVCRALYAAEKKSVEDQKRASFGDAFAPELVLMRQDRVCVEIRKENVGHHEPHMHVTHSDKIDASICLRSFEVLAGKIDGRTQKYLVKILLPKKAQLQAIWDELNEKENSVGAEALISNLDF
jgi:hypothetical protein